MKQPSIVQRIVCFFFGHSPKRSESCVWSGSGEAFECYPCEHCGRAVFAKGKSSRVPVA